MYEVNENKKVVNAIIGSFKHSFDIDLPIIKSGSEAVIYQLPYGNVLRVGVEKCWYDFAKFARSKPTVNAFPKIFGLMEIKAIGTFYFAEVEELFPIEKKDEEIIKSFENYIKQCWKTNTKMYSTSHVRLKSLIDAASLLRDEFKDIYSNDITTRNIMRREDNSFVLVDPIYNPIYVRR